MRWCTLSREQTHHRFMVSGLPSVFLVQLWLSFFFLWDLFFSTQVACEWKRHTLEMMLRLRYGCCDEQVWRGRIDVVYKAKSKSSSTVTAHRKIAIFSPICSCTKERRFNRSDETPRSLTFVTNTDETVLFCVHARWGLSSSSFALWFHDGIGLMPVLHFHHLLEPIHTSNLSVQDQQESACVILWERVIKWQLDFL